MVIFGFIAFGFTADRRLVWPWAGAPWLGFERENQKAQGANGGPADTHKTQTDGFSKRQKTDRGGGQAGWWTGWWTGWWRSCGKGGNQQAVRGVAPKRSISESFVLALGGFLPFQVVSPRTFWSRRGEHLGGSRVLRCWGPRCLGTTSCAHGLSFDGGGARPVRGSLRSAGSPRRRRGRSKTSAPLETPPCEEFTEAARVVSVDPGRRGRRAARGRTPFDP